MALPEENTSCQRRCWAIGLAAGVLVAILLGATDALSWLGAILVGLVVCGVSGLLLCHFLCGAMTTRATVGAKRPAPASGAGKQAGAPVASDAAAPVSVAGPVAATIGEATASPEKDSGEPGDTTEPDADLLVDAVAETAPEIADEPRTPDAEGTAGEPFETPDPVDSGETTPAMDTSPIAAERDSIDDDASHSDPVAIAASEPATESAGPTKPDLLSEAREGGADNLKEIKGVGPKLEVMLHRMGVFHFDQIAGWGPDETDWVDENLEGFKGRVRRDDWVAQARVLATGGDTDFSRKVGKGGVY